MKRQSLDDDFRSNLHKGGLGEIVKLTPDERKMCVKAAKAMGLTVAGVDFMRSERGALVLEVNANPGFSIEKKLWAVMWLAKSGGDRGVSDEVLQEHVGLLRANAYFVKHIHTFYQSACYLTTLVGYTLPL